MASKEEVQACVLQAAQELGYSFMKPAQVEVVLNFVAGRDVWGAVCVKTPGRARKIAPLT